MSQLRTRILIALTSSFFGWGSVMLASSSSCTRKQDSTEVPVVSPAESDSEQTSDVWGLGDDLAPLPVELMDGGAR